MEDKSPRRRPPLSIVIGLIAIALSAGSATAWFAWRAISPPAPLADFPEIEIEGEALPEGYDAPTTDPVDVPDLPADGPPAAGAATQGTLYWLAAEGDTVALNPVRVDLPAAASSTDTLELAFASLMDGPAAAGAATGIPDGTELLALTVEGDGVHVDLSQDFTTGGGSASMIGRLAQVVYTATTLEPTAPVWLSVEGEPLTLLGGEGLEIRQPITRTDLTTDFAVTAPAESNQ